jgi:hypothetical protein
MDDRLPREQRVTKIKPQRGPEPIDELDGDRFIETESLAQRDLLLLCCISPQHGRGGIAGREMHQREDNHADDEEHRNQQQQAADDVCQHALSPLPGGLSAIGYQRSVDDGPTSRQSSVVRELQPIADSR